MFHNHSWIFFFSTIITNYLSTSKPLSAVYEQTSFLLCYIVSLTLISWRATLDRLSMAAYSIYLQLAIISRSLLPIHRISDCVCVFVVFTVHLIAKFHLRSKVSVSLGIVSFVSVLTLKRRFISIFSYSQGD